MKPSAGMILMDGSELSKQIEDDLSKRVIDESIRKFPEEVGQVRILIDTLFGLGSLISSPSESYRRNNVFLVYFWEIWHLSRRSLIEALSGYYNAGFILLRTTLELMIKGIVYQCLSQKKFRDRANLLRSKKDWIVLELDKLLAGQPHLAEKFEDLSVSVFDNLESSFVDHKPKVKHLFLQISQWHLIDGIDVSIGELYSNLYGNLSSDVHALPNSTDTGRGIKSGETAFEGRHVVDKVLLEYLNSATQVIDFAMVITLNWIKENIQDKNSLRSLLTNYFKGEEVEKLPLQFFKKRYLELTRQDT